MCVILGVDIGGVGCDYTVVRNVKTGEMFMINSESGCEDVVSSEGGIEFKDIVVFISNNECPACERVMTAILQAGLMNEVNIYDQDAIEAHKLRSEIMTQLALQNMLLPVCVYFGKVLSIENFIANIETIKRLAKRTDGENPKYDAFDVEGREFNEACGLERSVASEVIIAGISMKNETDWVFSEDEDTVGTIASGDKEYEVYYGVRLVE